MAKQLRVIKRRAKNENSLKGFLRRPLAQHLSNKEAFEAAIAAGFKCKLRDIASRRWKIAEEAAHDAAVAKQAGPKPKLRVKQPEIPIEQAREPYPAPPKPDIVIIRGVETQLAKPVSLTDDDFEVEWKRLIMKVGTKSSGKDLG